MLPEVVVDVAAAIICFAAACHPVLVGNETPRGEFQLTRYSTKLGGYGGDLLAFKETDNYLYAIHRVIDVPGEERPARLKNPDAQQRTAITGGCINLDPSVYQELVRCCYGSKLIIK